MWKQAQYLEMKENSVLSLQKYPFTRRSDEEKKKDLGAWTRSAILYQISNVLYLRFEFGDTPSRL